MRDIMEEVGGDGFLISDTPIERRSVMEVCDGLVPELQRRGLTRKAYAHKHLADNLERVLRPATSMQAGTTGAVWSYRRLQNLSAVGHLVGERR
jgi:hypothetical protein